MPETEKLKRKMMLKVLASPVTAAPFMLGMTALAGTLATGARPDLGIVAGLAGVLGTIGVFFTRLILGADTYAKQAVQELQQEAHAEREGALDDLEGRLKQDGDARTESALQDLRSLTLAFQELHDTQAFKLNAQSTYEILSGVQRLFRQCVDSLEQTLKLWHTARGMVTKAAREPILKQREEILRDVAKSIRQLGQTLVGMQNLGAGDGVRSELVRIGEDLDRHLEVAKQVEQRIQAFERQIDGGVNE